MEESQMSKGRLEAFSDGVFAVIITIMVLNMNVPRGADFQALKSVLPIFLCYVLSYIYVGIYWNNHHHLLHASEHVNGGILWANLALLFCLSVVPFTTAWMGENDYAPLPVAVYGVMLLLAGIAYSILSKSLIAHHGKNSVLAKSIGKDWKGKVSLLVYALAIPLALVRPWIACACYTLVAVMWLVPDPRIEKQVHA
jgi:TMEM175 potassium channel family protein